MDAILLAVLLGAASQNINDGKGCGYPCNHYVHAAEGAAIAAALAHYGKADNAVLFTFGYAVGAELAGKVLHDKIVSGKDIATRTLGGSVGLWIYKQF